MYKTERERGDRKRKGGEKESMNFQGGSIRERERASIERKRQRKGERER